MNKIIVDLLIILILISCQNSANRINEKIDELYKKENIKIDDSNLFEIYLNDNRLKILKNLITVNELYSENDSINKESLKINVEFEEIKSEQKNLDNDIAELEKRLRSRLRE